MEHPTHDGAARTPPRLGPARRLLHRIASGTAPRVRAAVRFVALAPTLARQASQVRRNVPHLAEAAGTHGIATTICQGAPRNINAHSLDPDSPHAYHLLVLGDSVAAGVGLDHHRNSVAGRLASLLSEGCGHPVAWHVLARSGADARECLTFTEDADDAHRLATCDAVLVSVGVNDVLAPRTLAAWRRDLDALLTRLTTLNPEAPVVLLGVPPIDAFPAMPRELGAFLGRRARRFDETGRDVALRHPSVHHLPLADPEISLNKAFADDGFHPSAKMHKHIAKRADTLVRDSHRRQGMLREEGERPSESAALRGA